MRKSSLPSCPLLVPFGTISAVLIGVVLDDLLGKGFRDTKERVVVLALAVLQVGICCAAPFVKQSQPFQGPALVFAGLLAVGCVTLWLDKFAVWVGINAIATAALIIGALVITPDKVEEYSSGRPVAAAMLSTWPLNVFPPNASTVIVARWPGRISSSWVSLKFAVIHT